MPTGDIIIFSVNTVPLFTGLMEGLGAYYGNLNALPLEESFFGGGANDIRAWAILLLGPGSFHDSTNTKYDKTGDIKLETNLDTDLRYINYGKSSFCRCREHLAKHIKVQS